MTKEELQRMLDDRDRTIQNLNKMNSILRKLVVRLSRQSASPDPEETKEYRVH